MPALLTSTSSLPKCLVVAVTTAAQSSSLVTSSGSNRAEAPMASAYWRPSCSSTSAITTLAPSRANRRAVAAPMPDAAPEMMATLPASLIAVLPFALKGAQRPEKFGRRFWAKAHTASWWSLERFDCVSRLRLRSPAPLCCRRTDGLPCLADHDWAPAPARSSERGIPWPSQAASHPAARRWAYSKNEVASLAIARSMAPLANQMEGKMPEPLKRKPHQARGGAGPRLFAGGHYRRRPYDLARRTGGDRGFLGPLARRRFRRPGPRGLRPARADARRGRREPCRFGDDDRVHHRCAARRTVQPAPPGDLRRQFPGERLDNRRRLGASGNAGRGARCRGRKVSRPISHPGRPLTTQT